MADGSQTPQLFHYKADHILINSIMVEKVASNYNQIHFSLDSYINQSH